MPGKTNVERAKNVQKSIAERMERRNFFTAEQGDNELRILPPWKDDLDWPFYETKQHRLSDRVIYICNKGHDGETFCYTCDVVLPALYKGSEKDQALANRISPRDRVFCNVLARADEDRGCQIWGISMTNYGHLVSYFSDPEYDDITDIKTGTDIILNRTGTGKDGTKYAIRAKRKTSPLKNKDILVNLYDLDDACGGAPAAEHKRMLNEALGLSFDEEPDFVETEEAEEDDSFEFAAKEEEEESPEPEETEEETEEESDETELTPIKVPKSLKGTKKRLFLQKSEEMSDCFAILFDENATECIEECESVVNCMAKFSSKD